MRTVLLLSITISNYSLLSTIKLFSNADGNIKGPTQLEGWCNPEQLHHFPLGHRLANLRTSHARKEVWSGVGVWKPLRQKIYVYHVKTTWAMHYRLGTGVTYTVGQYRTSSSWCQNSEIKGEYLSSSTFLLKCTWLPWASVLYQQRLLW